MSGARTYVEIPYSRTFPHGADDAYAWLTDYQDDDHTKAGAIIRRRDVVKREGNRVHLRGELEAVGRKLRGDAVVTLFPTERRWVAELGKGSSIYEYRLTPVPGGVRLDVRYRMGARTWSQRVLMRLLRRRITRELDKMWDGFAAAMAREIPAAPAPAR